MHNMLTSDLQEKIEGGFYNIYIYILYNSIFNSIVNSYLQFLVTNLNLYS